MGLFKEGGEEIGMASVVVKVEHYNPATPGSLRGDRARRYVGNTQYWLRAI